MLGDPSTSLFAVHYPHPQWTRGESGLFFEFCGEFFEFGFEEFWQEF